METYHFMTWDAELIQNPIRLEEVLSKLDILNKPIKHIRIYGNVYEGFGDPSKSVTCDDMVEFIFFDDSKFAIDYSESSTLKVGRDYGNIRFGE